MDYFPLCNSLRISFISTIITFCTGIIAAYYVIRLPSAIKNICDTLLLIPMILPPTVIGYFILVTLSPTSMLGKMLFKWFSATITMRWQASVIAVVIVTFPLMYRTVRGTFEAFDQNLIDAGKTLGLSNAFIFFHILLPNCKQGILAGMTLAFARGLGEYGATSMVSGYIIGKTATISTSVAYYWQINQEQIVLKWVIINIIISFIVVWIMNIIEKNADRKLMVSFPFLKKKRKTP